MDPQEPGPRSTRGTSHCAAAGTVTVFAVNVRGCAANKCWRMCIMTNAHAPFRIVVVCSN